MTGQTQPPDRDPHHHATGEPAWVHGHAHEPNPAPPSLDATFTVQISPPLSAPPTSARTWSAEALHLLPHTIVRDCYIVSTGHGTSGPFTFGGVRLLDFLTHLAIDQWQQVDVISADGFGTRLHRQDLLADPPARPSLLALTRNDQPLRREEGLVRLIVPTETDDALKQVKWVVEIVVR